MEVNMTSHNQVTKFKVTPNNWKIVNIVSVIQKGEKLFT